MKRHSFSSQHMDTTVHMSVYLTENRRDIENFIHQADEVFAKLEKQFSLFIPESEISQLNQQAGVAVQVTPLFLEITQRAVFLSTLTGQAFNPLTGGENFSGHIQINPYDSTVQIPMGCQLDLNALVKGLAIDEAIDVFPEGIPVLIEAGGDVKVKGFPPHESCWSIGIRDPFEPQSLITALPIKSGAVCTSGMYFRGRHLTNTTRELNTRVASVTVTAPTAIEADALSTALFFYGIDGGIQLVNSLLGFGCLIVDTQGDVFMGSLTQRLLQSIVA